MTTTYEVFYLSREDSLGYFEAETEEEALEAAAKWAYPNEWKEQLPALFTVEFS